MLVDDDPQTREAAVAELQHAEVPVRAFDDGNAALSAIAEEKPDVIVLELGTGGDMGGKDLVNFVKATMEWVDIPIILWTREPVASQKEARQIHGADEVVPKSGGAAALVARVITVFRRASPRAWSPASSSPPPHPAAPASCASSGSASGSRCRTRTSRFTPARTARRRSSGWPAPRASPWPARRRCPCSPRTPRCCATGTSWASPRTSGTP